MQASVGNPGEDLSVFEITKLTPDDWELLRDVRLASLEDAPEAFGSTYHRTSGFDETEWRSRAEGGQWFIAWDDDTPVGIATGYPSENGAARLGNMWVHPAVRGSSAAQQLLSAVMEWAANAGANRLACKVIETNERAMRFYKKAGFVPSGHTEPLVLDPQVTVHELQLQLTPIL